MLLRKSQALQIIKASRTVAVFHFTVVTVVALGTFSVAAQTSKTAEGVLRHFYTNYLNFDLRKAQKAKPPQLKFSRAFLKDRKENEASCRKIKDMPCGFGADGDPYLDAQDFGDELNARTAQLDIQKLSEEAKDFLKVKVSFFLFPGSDTRRRVLIYHMKRESSAWRVDDIEYESGDTARTWMQKETRENQAMEN